MRHSGINSFIFELICVRGSMSLRAFLRVRAFGRRAVSPQRAFAWEEGGRILGYVYHAWEEAIAAMPCHAG